MEELKETSQQPIEETTQQPMEETTQQPVEENTQQSVEETVQQPVEETAQQPTEEPAQQPTEEPAQQPTEEPAQQPTEEPAQQPAEEPAQQPAEEPAQQPTEEPAQQPTEEPAKQPEKAEWVEPEEDYSNFDRQQLVDKLEELLQNEITTIKNRVAQIKNLFANADREFRKAAYDEYIAAGGEKDKYEQPDDPVSQQFRKLYNIYREKRQQHIDAVEAQKQQNLKQKQEILAELKTLLDSDGNIKKLHDGFNAIQERWKTIGDVPRSEMNNLWQSYHFLVEQLFDKLRISKELRMLDLKRNMEQKVVLCEKAEELIMEPSINTAFKNLQSLREQWREIGPVPVEKNDEIWARFCNACDQIEARHREYFEQRKKEFENNLLAKQALCEKAEELTTTLPNSIKEWNEKSTALDDLLKFWKSIGPISREANNEIWNRFKSCLDKFYAQKKEYFDKIRDEQTENYNKKIDLCLRAEAIAKRQDWKKATEEMLKLQEEWKQIGAVNRKTSEKIWQRFRAACDEFFTHKSEHFKNLRGEESENLAKKEAIIAQLKEYKFGDDKEENLRIIKDFQRQWMEIGYVPVSEKERLKNEFRKVLDAHFEQLKISAREAEESAYRERIRNVVGNVTRFANDERADLTDKISRLKADINLWDNNLGFLSNSKQANILKEEFEHKVQSARQQLALLETKLRILNDAAKNDKIGKGSEPAPAPEAEPANEPKEATNNEPEQANAPEANAE